MATATFLYLLVTRERTIIRVSYVLGVCIYVYYNICSMVMMLMLLLDYVILLLKAQILACGYMCEI